MAVVVVAALVAVASNYTAPMRTALLETHSVPLIWSQLQLATLAVMAVREGCGVTGQHVLRQTKHSVLIVVTGSH